MSIFKKQSNTDQDIPPELFIEQSKNGSADLQALNNKLWGLGNEEHWDVDMEKGTITFTFPDKVVSADIQVVGSLHNGSFMWGWDHPSVPKSLSRAASLTKQWGKKYNKSEYTERLVPANEEKAWEFTAIAARLDEASGTYSGATGEARVYMTFGKFTMNKR